MKLYPRSPGPSKNKQVQLKAEAHRMLDHAKAGGPMMADEIKWALIQTGDWMEPIPTPMVIEPKRNWRSVCDSQNQLDAITNTRQD